MDPTVRQQIERMLAELASGSVSRVMIQVLRRDASGKPESIQALVDRGMHQPQGIGIRRTPGAAIRAAMTCHDEDEDLI